MPAGTPGFIRDTIWADRGLASAAGGQGAFMALKPMRGRIGGGRRPTDPQRSSALSAASLASTQVDQRTGVNA